MDTSDARREELINFQKCVKGNLPRLLALTDIGICCGSAVDSDLCVAIPKPVLGRVIHDAVKLMVTGMKVCGGVNNWSSGCFGSRWFDMDASEYGLDHIRAAFYSKKHSSGEWTWDKPYAIRIIAEKTKAAPPPSADSDSESSGSEAEDD